MRIQLLSDLHLETEACDLQPAPGADLLVLAGDIDSSWAALERFRDWREPIVFVAGNHEFDGRELNEAWPALRARCADLGITMLEQQRLVVEDASGRRVRFVGATRWCDFDLFGPSRRESAMRAARYFMQLMGSTRDGRAYDPVAVREDALAARAWLESELAQEGDWDTTVAITHFAPSLRSADPRYGAQSGTASFCNADDDLLRHAALWIHGHLHCAHDYVVAHPAGATRVVCNSRGHVRKGEGAGHRPLLVLEV